MVETLLGSMVDVVGMVDAPDEDGITALYAATLCLVDNTHLESTSPPSLFIPFTTRLRILRCLIQASADVDAVSPAAGVIDSPLLLAIGGFQHEAASALLAAGANGRQARLATR